MRVQNSKTDVIKKRSMYSKICFTMRCQGRHERPGEIFQVIMFIPNLWKNKSYLVPMFFYKFGLKHFYLRDFFMSFLLYTVQCTWYIKRENTFNKLTRFIVPIYMYKSKLIFLAKNRSIVCFFFCCKLKSSNIISTLSTTMHKNVYRKKPSSFE